MATLTQTLKLALALGAENIDPSIVRSFAVAEKVADIVVKIAENQASAAPTTLWVSSQHGVATNPLVSPFTTGLFLVDPDAANASILPLSIEIASTRHNSTTVDKIVRRVDRNTPLLFPSSMSGQSIAEVGDGTDLFALLGGTAPTNVPRITRIRVHNPNPAAAGVNDVVCRLLLLK